jgi:SAM-dependent methyltransferase
LAEAFDQQAAKFETAPVQSDPVALARLVQFADLPPGCRVLDAGCGPGLVSEAFLNTGQSVFGVDLSAEMIERARRRCARFGDRASFEQRSLFDSAITESFDVAVSRLVLHHTPDAAQFIARLFELLRPGGVLMLCDHTTDPKPSAAEYHQRLERGRDRTHVQNLTAGGLADAVCAAGFEDIRLSEHRYYLDFDEWFDRGTPAEEKETVRRLLLSGPSIRGFRATKLDGNAVRIEGWLVTVRATKPQAE